MTAYDVAGAGQTIVFLHAALGDRRMWRPQFEEFAATHRVVAIDSPGFGSAIPPDAPFNRADHVISVLDELGVSHAVFVGASMGGRIAVEIAVIYPDRVQGLMLVGAPRTGHDWSASVQQLWQLEAGALEAADLERAVAVNLDFWLDGPDRDRATLADADRALVATMQRRAFELELAHPDARESRRAAVFERVNEIAVPTRVLFGADDAPDIAEIAYWYTNEIESASLHEIADSAHLPSLEQPARCNQLLRDLLSEVGAG